MPRPRAENPTKQIGISARCSDWEWLALWFPSGNESQQFRELLERARKFWPDGPNGSGAINTRKSRPGGVRDLRKQIRLLEQQVTRLGAEPVTRQTVAGENSD